MALSPKQDNGSNGFSPTIARPAPAIPGVSAIPNLGGDADRGPRAEAPKQLIVGPEIELTGQIAACESLIVEGTVAAELNNSRRIEITETGSFKGNVEIEEAIIAGRFDGELTVRNRLKVTSSGRIVGVIRYAQLEIEAGGQISGTVEILAGQMEMPVPSTEASTSEIIQDDDPDLLGDAE